MRFSLSKRLGMLLLLLAGGMSFIFALPKAPKQAPPPGVATSLPSFVDEWYGQDAEVTEKERTVLGSETRFARKLYTNSRGSAFLVSIVFSGEDMSTSIHRPERCLPAQGFTMTDSRSVSLPIGGKHPLTMMRLHNLRPIYDAKGRPVTFPNGQQANEFSLVYYWFVGSKETTANHLERYFFDARDRILMGTTQRWAYVMVTSRITDNVEKFGLNEAQTDALLRDFIQKLMPMIQGKDVLVR